jgi:hypothetical protein
VARGVIQEVPQRQPNGMRGYGASVEQQSQPGCPSHIGMWVTSRRHNSDRKRHVRPILRRKRMHKMKTVLFGALVMVEQLAARPCIVQDEDPLLSFFARVH